MKPVTIALIIVLFILLFTIANAILIYMSEEYTKFFYMFFIDVPLTILHGGCPGH